MTNEILHRRAAAAAARVAESTPAGQTAAAELDVAGHLRDACR